jgi:lipopolysaccharide assembly protein A
MRYLLWILKLVLFLLVFLFMVKNTDTVTVHYYLGGKWQAPLFLVIAIAFGAGVALGLAAGLARIFRQRREIAALRRSLGEGGGQRGGAEARAKLQNEFQA